MKSILSSTTSALRRWAGLHGPILFLVLVSLLCWYSQPWQWFAWSERPNWALVLSVLRVVAYAIMAVSFTYNAVDDLVHGRRTDIVWSTLAFLYVFSIALLALDLGDIAAWIETRSLLTIPALLAADAVSWQTSQRIIDKQKIREVSVDE